MPLAVEVKHLNHWTAREVPTSCILDVSFVNDITLGIVFMQSYISFK